MGACRRFAQHCRLCSRPQRPEGQNPTYLRTQLPPEVCPLHAMSQVLVIEIGHKIRMNLHQIQSNISP